MVRIVALLLTALVVVPLTALVLACGSSDSDEPQPSLGALNRPVGATAERSAEQKAEAQKAAEGMWMWPEGQGPARDLDADGDACAAEIREDPAKRSQSGIGIMVLLARCLEEKGWQRDPNWKAP